MALQAQTNREYQLELLQQKEEFENAIRNYVGEDPLENYYNYISWVEQSYPKHGHEGNLVPLLEHCLSLFENDKRYTNDRRFCKLWIKYFDLQQNPLELYHMMRAKGLCRGCADLYRAWAYYYEAAGDFQSANNVFEDGKRALAQPYEDLENAHQNLIMAAGQHVLFGPDENRLMEKRQALTSLHTYRPGRVGSVRVPSSNGVVTVPASNASIRSNAMVFVYEDRGGEVAGAEAAPLSIITAARRQEAPKENALKPGPWTTVPVKTRVVGGRSTLGFTVHEDLDIPEGIRLPKNHPTETFEDYSDWRVSIKYPEPPNPAMIPMYPKERVYIDPNTEYSIEELRAPRYIRRNDSRLHIPQIETCQAVQSILEGVEDMQDSLHEMKSEILQHTINNPGADIPSLHENQFLQSFQQNQSIHESFQKLQDVQHNFSHHGDDVQRNEFLLGNQESFRQMQNRMEDQIQNNFAIWSESPSPRKLEVWNQSEVRPASNHLVVYEQSIQDIQPQIQPKGSAMKTVFKDLNADELAETGSRGGMDIATTAQAADSAKPMPLFSDNSSSSFEDINCGNQDRYQDIDTSCNTQMFNFNLNAMKVSTPQSKQAVIETIIINDEEIGSTRKQLFPNQNYRKKIKLLAPFWKKQKALDNRFLRSSSSSSGAATKSSIFNNHTNKMGTISEEHNSYLAQNLMANAALRSSLLGNFMDFDGQQSPHVVETAAVEMTSMQSSPLGSPVRQIPPPIVVQPLDYAPSDPFKASLINQLLERVAFPGPHIHGYVNLLSNPRICIRKNQSS
ncbi:hypothetical protein NQ318_011048 [Aromia moschata]|uniref:BUB1 N-terminal domain-containing protein n=1 Tax=Aromia moschata TaxID=1265417 RepID=A0AAV8YSI6_9CUCU|nr:hypothetical protein NQ318_011048 [Aromia moschata]